MSILLEVKDLHKTFHADHGSVKAVDGVSFTLKKGETLGIVGESGCGKTTLGRTVLGLIQADGGEILWKGQNITGRKKFPGREKMQIIFQDPYNSADPGYTVEKIILEACRDKKKVDELMARVGLTPAEKYRYPHELSGGQLQRAGIARALAMNPEFIVCDEPVSALDVSYQSKIISLLEELQEEQGLAYLFISHDLAVVRHIADRIAIMYRGKIVETAPARTIAEHPLHPYTRFLLSAVPGPFDSHPDIPVKTEEAVNPAGCVFAYRCPFAEKDCYTEDIPLKKKDTDHLCACIYSGYIDKYMSRI